MSRPGQEGGPAAVAAPAGTDLEAFAAAHGQRHGPLCYGCRLPEHLRDDLRGARASDPGRYTYSLLAAYCKSKGHPISPSCLRDHFNRGHEAEVVA